MLSGVTVSCFLLSYVLALLVEVAGLFWRTPGRNIILVATLAAGLVAHSIFLVHQFSFDAQRPQLLANWFQWVMLSAWGLAVANFVVTLRNANRSMGLFLLPVVLGLLGLAEFVRDLRPFQPETTIGLWRAIHGVSLLVGTMFICFGLAFGVMYLVQSYRLKAKRRPGGRFKLPALEFLQRMNRLSLCWSSVALGLGMLSGVLLNLNREGQIAWLSSGILFTCALFVWSLIAAVMEFSAVGSLGGRRSAYLVISNFVFLVLVLSMLLLSSHGQPEPSRSGASGPIERHGGRG